jgi:hypothetical protein
MPRKKVATSRCSATVTGALSEITVMAPSTIWTTMTPADTSAGMYTW